MNLENFEDVAAVLSGRERVYFDFMCFTGLRKDEGNRVRWGDIDFDRGWFHVPGTKTEESDNHLPLAPALLQELGWLYHNARESEYLFPGHSKQTKGKKIYSRRRLFEKIERLTSSCQDCDGNKISKRRFCQDCRRIDRCPAYTVAQSASRLMCKKQ